MKNGKVFAGTIFGGRDEPRGVRAVPAPAMLRNSTVYATRVRS